MNQQAGANDSDDFYVVASGSFVSNIGLILWLVSGPRDLLTTLFVFLGGLVVGALGWIVLAERRLPRRPAFRRGPVAWNVDRVAGVLTPIMFAVLNLTWRTWLPGIDIGARIPLMLLPESFDALRLGLTAILATSLALATWIVLRIMWPPGKPTLSADRGEARSVELA